MGSTLIAVAGTLAGVLVTAGFGLLTAVATMRSQRIMAREQADVQVSQQVRADRKEAFVGYLSAYRLMYDSAVRIANDDEYDSLRRGKIRLAPPSTFEVTFPEVVSQFAQAYYTLQIIAGSGTRGAARTANETLWALANGSFTASESDFERLDRTASDARNTLRDSMRIELGVEG